MAVARDCKLLTVVMVVVTFTAAAGTGVSGTDSPPPPASAPDCINPHVTISPCLDYMTGINNATAQPTEDCCSLLASVLADKPACLCQFFRSSDFLGFTISPTLAIALPAACNINPHPQTCTDISFTIDDARAPQRAEHRGGRPRTPTALPPAPTPPVDVAPVPSSDTGDTVPPGFPENTPKNPDGRHKHGSGAGPVVTPGITVMVWQLFLIIGLG